MKSKKEMMEFLDSILTIQEWNQEQLDIIAEIRSNIEQCKTNCHLKKILLEGIRSLPYVNDFIEQIGGLMSP